MRFGAASASRGQWRPILDRILPAAQETLAGAPAHLAILLATNHFEDDMPAAAAQVRETTQVPHLIGCTAEGVIGPEHEHEREPAIAVWLAHLPQTQLASFAFSQAQAEAADSEADWRRILKAEGHGEPSFILLGDPFSLDVNSLLGGINKHLSRRPVVGGMASGAEAPGQSVLILNDQVLREGAVGVMLSGGITIDTIVSQGCRPVGEPHVITLAEHNIIHQLGGKKPLAVLSDVYARASEADQQLMQQGIFLGRVINEQQEEFHRGDFLIRNVIGVDQNSGAIAVGDLVRAGITVQFHVRDAATADEDLRALLSHQGPTQPVGALLFSCNGRGTRMYRDRDHDLGVLHQSLGTVPLVGFFCAGELGPIGGKNFIHGHTASIALFRPAVPSA